YSITFEMAMGISFDNRPPWALRRLGFRCLYTRLIPSTTTLFFWGRTRSTRPVVRALGVPASSPVSTSTHSSFLKCLGALCLSDHLGRQTDDARKAPLAQLPRHRAKNARAARVLLGVDQDEGVAVEADVAAVVAARRLPRPHDHALDHVARLDVAAGDRLL